MSTNRVASDWHRLGAGLSVRFTVSPRPSAPGGIEFECEWAPRMWTKREQKRLIDRYRRARNEFLGSIVRATGKDLVVVEGDA